MEVTVHVTFSEDDEAISQSSTEGDAINFNENRSFPNDEFLEPMSEVTYDVQPSPTISPSAEVIIQTHVPQDRWSREKHIELMNIISEPLAGIITRSRIRDSDAASASECLYVNFLSEMEPKKLIESLEEEGLEAIRIFLAYAAYMGFMVYRMDVKSAFLNGKISKEVYVQQPSMFESSEYPNHVCKLDKALYGLKQAPKAWYETLSKFLIEHKFVRGPDESGISINETLFRGMIGSLMYLIASRPDIQFSTCLCARYQANPKESRLVAVKRIFRYLKGTPKGSSFNLKAYFDSDYARCNLDRKSTSGGCQILREKLVCWSARKQSSVAMSLAEAEYVAAIGCCAQVL
ncbi:retrovirus-related pol polyprotein from transposon TNT 1-94 [Tanacetum coccineum]|uniref:Retrovirus-related pol polyprotein from transposon TNT 1-94 n=1 Tax=Tanacetum coccineum TaxID=301880 RepID=A0ABQ5FYA9_9ASTR